MNLSERQPWIAKFREECEALGLVWVESTWDRPTGTTKGLFVGKPQALAARTVIFLHGLGDDLLFPQVRLFRHLLSAGWSIATCDMDGHGVGNTSFFSSVDARSVAASLVNFVESFCPGRAKLHLVGFSLGGALLLDYAIHNPERVESLTMIGTPIKTPSKMPLWTELVGFFDETLREARHEFGWYRSVPALGPFKRSHYPVRLAPDAKTTYLGEARLLFESLTSSEALMVIPFPTLYMAGGRDMVAPIELARSLELPPERLQIQKIDDATHFSSILNPKSWKRLEIFLRTVSRV